MNETTYYQRNKDVVLNRRKYYYKNNKERLKENEVLVFNGKLSSELALNFIKFFPYSPNLLFTFLIEIF